MLFYLGPRNAAFAAAIGAALRAAGEARVAALHPGEAEHGQARDGVTRCNLGVSKNETGGYAGCGPCFHLLG